MKRDVRRPLLAVAGIGLLLIGAAGWLLLAWDFARADEHGSRNLLSCLIRQRPWLEVCLAGGILYAARGINLAPRYHSLRDRRGPFDFQATFAPYIYHETWPRFARRWALGFLVFFLAMLAGAASRVAADGMGRAKGDEVPFLIALLWGGGFLSVVLMIVSFRIFARRAESVLRRNRRRPILYLRSFKADTGIFSGLLDLVRMALFGGLRDSTEMALRRAVKNVGPLVAVGRPNERLPSLGAARLYVRDDWQGVVARLADEAQFVIFRIGRTEGFWWEVEHVLRHCDPRRVFIYLPKEDRGKTYRTFVIWAARYFPHPLPGKLGQATFLGFGPDWQPQLLGAEGPSFAASFRWLLVSRAAGIREALNEGLAPLGVNARPLPWFFREVLMLCVLPVVLFNCCCMLPVGLATKSYEQERKQQYDRSYEERLR